MIQRMLEYLFGCWHKNCSFPITAKAGKRHNEAASVTGTYVVCLDCGQEFPYDWREMKVVTMPRKRAAAAASMGETADEPLPRSA
jgi:hypothetical protein